MHENSITRTIHSVRRDCSNYPTRCSNGRDSRRRGVTSGGERARGAEGRGEIHFIPPPLGAIEAGAMLGSHRERNPSRSENWHRRTTIYIPLFPPLAAARRILLPVPPTSPARIPRNSAAGDWRWRPRALRDKPHQHTAAHQRGSQPPTKYTSSSSRPRNFR